MDLSAIDQLAAGIRAGGGWFSRTAMSLDSGEAELTSRLAGADISPITTWPAARAAAHASDGPAYDHDAAEQHRLRDVAFAAAGQHAVLARLTHVVDAGLRPMMDGARDALIRAGMVDDELARVAAGSASEAAYRAALAYAAGEHDHRFVVRYNLFARGRWPIGMVDGRFAIL